MTSVSESVSDTETAPVASPCVRICCLDDGDVCLGCFRTLDEIRHWQASDSDTRLTVLQHCAQRREAHERRFPGGLPGKP